METFAETNESRHGKRWWWDGMEENQKETGEEWPRKGKNTAEEGKSHKGCYCQLKKNSDKFLEIKEMIFIHHWHPLLSYVHDKLYILQIYTNADIKCLISD